MTALAAQCRRQAYEIGAKSDPLEAIQHVDWNSRTDEFPDWRRGIQPQLADIWESLSIEARLVLYMDAAIHAQWSVS